MELSSDLTQRLDNYVLGSRFIYSEHKDNESDLKADSGTH